MSVVDVILREKIAKLGKLGAIVQVKAGYARNFLIPKKKAVYANKRNLAIFEEERAALEAAAADSLTTAERRAAEMAEIELTLTAKAGDEGKLFGSITARDLSEAITSAGVKVTKNEIRMKGGHIRSTGEYDITVQLHPDVSSSIKVFVEAE